MDWFLYDRNLRHERVKPTWFFFKFEKQEGNDKFLKSTLTISDKCWNSVNLSCKTYTRGVFRTQSNIYSKAFLWFLQRSSTTDVRVGSKYASAHIYMQVSPIEIMCIWNIFALKYTFFDKRKMELSELKEISFNSIFLYLESIFYISLFVFPL